ncbi:precorrin-6y C5,15-methyltransferase (decarboxylating) subunit CbiE [Desulfovibrio sp. JC022]|uniref:precorrin-6y C5,15-methyltransferase (decarboxylating) subunit CbiE n=1 Tax=Desulfovibrio sp. JC022 TaxID=2593642 RepID=UPI0013D187A8|nr:precorrin-6y C5,15-methyltransferase (decarboxylating) subunit CbiE [Desulfovibrio sp. JC022]NDV24376.1 precorrin-6y C5,15-methyltransferase (decarboxylating) subunit CbiE [Desulfovibrio sp. JC022]
MKHNMIHPLQIIGLHPGSLEPSQKAAENISKADILSGGKRLLEAFPKFKGEKIPFSSPVKEYAKTLEKLLAKGKKVVLLADGDPLLFGIAQSLIPMLGEENVTITPSLSTIQLGAARLGCSWKDFEIISLHGRNDFSPLFGAMQRKKDCAVYTDQTNTPQAIAKRLLEKGVDNYFMVVLARLGTPEEKITRGRPESFLNFTCADLNIVILTVDNKESSTKIFGREDDSFTREKGLITKLPVRSTGIALLDIRPNQTVWDLGAGCGSVAIDASFITTGSRFFAIEQKPERVEMIKENIRRFKAWSVEPTCGTMPQALAELPDPERIFMGGGIGRDDSVIREAAKRLKPGGRLVVHAILMGSIQRSRDLFEELGWNWQSMQIQASTSDKLAGDIRYKAHNPVTILWADKPEG